MIYSMKADLSHIFVIVQQVSEQSARSILSFPRVLVVLHIGPAYQEVLWHLLLDVLDQLLASDAHLLPLHSLLPLQLLDLLPDDCLLLLLIAPCHIFTEDSSDVFSN